MKATGIIRKVDELGRIVLPKDIRRSLNLKVGTPLEIYINGTSLILRQYSQLQNLQEQANDIAECLHKNLECDTVVSDLNNVIACYGKNKKHLENASISQVLSKIIEERKIVIHNKLNNQKSLFNNIELENIKSVIICPIVVNGDCLGCIVCLDENKEFSPTDAKCVNILNCLLCKNCDL